MVEKDISVYIVTHKPTNNIDKYVDEGYKKIMVGPNNNSFEEYISDDFIGGISEKNSNYSELTAQYYIWKNNKSKIVGLIHYRRILSISKFPILRYRALKSKQIEKILNNNQAIISRGFKLDETVREHYYKNHYSKDFLVLEDVIQEKYPLYYNEFIEYSNQRYLHGANMVITSKEIFDNYSEWLFEIMFEVEQRIDISSYDNYQKRIFGFMSERLLYVWMKVNKIKLKEVKMIGIEQNQFKVLLFPLYKFLFRRKKNEV